MISKDIKEKAKDIKIAKFRGGDFVERQQGQSYFENLFQAWPNQITFYYGPKSSGKTTLLEKIRESFLKSKKKNDLSFFWYELREQSFTSYKKILPILFPLQSGKDKKMKRDIHLFQISRPERDKLQSGEILPYQIMNDRIDRECKKNKKVIIVIDELQSLKGIYLDDNNLFNELLNYFVRLTKVEHKASVILVTSDAHFIEDLFKNSRLEGCSDYFFLDFLNEAEVYSWLSRLKFKDNEIELIWEKVGGYSWLLMQIILRKKQNGDWKKVIKDSILQARSKIVSAVNQIEEESLKSKIMVFLKKIFKEKGEMNLAFGSFDRKVLDYLVDNEIIFYDPVNVMIKLQFKHYLTALEQTLDGYKEKPEEEDWFPD
ncbi:MAG: AAA family ATPase [Spirochaetes bacterium]|nr:AAA family ATPase [Spirochaetota bacterium]